MRAIRVFLLLWVLTAASVYGEPIPGTIVLDKITLGDTTATLKSIGDTVEMKGTPKQVATTAARDLIPAARRTEGMECWVISESQTYQLVGGVENANWVVIRTGAQLSRMINVLDYGAVPTIHPDNGTPVSLTIRDNSTNIINAIAAAAGSYGHSNVVFFPPGIYRTTTNLWVPKNVFLEGSGVFFKHGLGDYGPFTNNYSIIWRTGQGDCVTFYQQFNNGIANISLHGGTNAISGPNYEGMQSADLGNIGLRVYNEDTFWNMGFHLENVGTVGFRAGIFNEANNTFLDRPRMPACDVGYVSASVNDYAELTADGLDAYNDILLLASNRNGTVRTSFARGEQTVINLPWAGERTNSLCYLLLDTRSVTILQDSSFHFRTYAVMLDSLLEVRGAQLEMDTWAGTNFVRAYGSANTLNISSAYIVGNAALPTWAMIRSMANGFIGSLEGNSLNSFPTFGTTGEPLLLEYQKNTVAELRNFGTRGIVKLLTAEDWWTRADNTTMFASMGQHQLQNPFYGVADVGATNMQYRAGQIGIQHSHYVTEHDYLSGILWFSDGFTQFPRFTRWHPSDPDTAQEVADRGNRVSTNYTYARFRADTLTARSGIITNSTVLWRTGTGSPESVVVAPIGSLFSRTDGSTDTALYRKETGTDSTGWVAVSAGGGGGTVSDTAFGSSWNGVTTISGSKNSLYDWAHTFDTDDDGLVNVLDATFTGGAGTLSGSLAASLFLSDRYASAGGFNMMDRSGTTMRVGEGFTTLDFRPSGAVTVADNIRMTFNPGASAAGINVGAIAGDPATPSNGDLWYDSTANELTARINGATVALGVAGASGIPTLDGKGTNTVFYSTAVGAGDAIEVYNAEDGFFYSADDHSLRVDLEEGELFHGGSMRVSWGGRGLSGAWTTDNTFGVGGALTVGGGTSVAGIRHGISGAMVAGVVTVTDAGCSANTRYFFTTHTIGTIALPASYYASTRTASTSFVITSSQVTDTSTIDWMAIEP